MYGICHLSSIPCRKEAADTSEMVSQLLFGEHFTVLENSEKWTRIRNESDGYESWISSKQYLPINVNTFNELNNPSRFYTSELVSVISSNGQALPVLLGSTLPLLKNGICRSGEESWKYEGQAISSLTPASRSGIVETALLYLNAPYLWGGRSPFGIDCSGFTQMVYKLNGKSLKRDAWQQAEEGVLLSFVEEAAPGDLAFFDNPEGRIIHVGIILEGNRIIHASGQVRIDSFDHHGIFHLGNKKYSHNLRMIRRIL